MSLFPIFKVNLLTNKDTINKIIVFCGSLNINIDTNTNIEKNKNIENLFIENPRNELFVNIFTENELKEILDKNIVIVWVNENIHIDDNIGSIKIKIIYFI